MSIGPRGLSALALLALVLLLCLSGYGVHRALAGDRITGIVLALGALAGAVVAGCLASVAARTGSSFGIHASMPVLDARERLGGLAQLMLGAVLLMGVGDRYWHDASQPAPVRVAGLAGALACAAVAAWCVRAVGRIPFDDP